MNVRSRRALAVVLAGVVLLSVFPVPGVSALAPAAPVGPAPGPAADAAARAPPAPAALAPPAPAPVPDLPAPAADSAEPAFCDRGTLEAFVDGAMATTMERHHVSGATVAVVRANETLLVKGYGYADWENETGVYGESTPFRVASLSKLVVATAVMQQVEAGRLSLDRDVDTYLADSPVSIPDTYSEPITLRHLLTHTAGFEDRYDGYAAGEPTALRPLGEALAASRPARVMPPGEVTAYSNWGVALAAHIVAEVSDTPFETYAEQQVFGPLGMAHATFEQPVPSSLGPQARTYSHVDGRYQPAPVEYLDAIRPAGAMSASAGDMARFMRMFLAEGVAVDSPAAAPGPVESAAALDQPPKSLPRVLQPQSVAAMQSRVFANDPRVNGMGLVFKHQTENGHPAVAHGGDLNYAHARLVLVPEHNLGVFVAYSSPGGSEAREDFLEAFFDRFLPAATRIDHVPPPAGFEERLAVVTGEYRSTRVPVTSWHSIAGLGLTMSVRSVGPGEIETTIPLFPTDRWVEIGPYEYRRVGGRDRIVFTVEDGRASQAAIDSVPSMAFERVAWWEGVLPQFAAFGAVAFLAIVTLLHWILGFLRRIGGRLVVDEYRPGGLPTRTDGGLTLMGHHEAMALVRPEGPGLVKLVVAGTCLVQLAFLASLVGIVADVPALLAGTSPYEAFLLPLALAAAVGGLATVAGTALAFRRRYFTIGGRFHLALLALAGTVFGLQLAHWHFLPV